MSVNDRMLIPGMEGNAQKNSETGGPRTNGVEVERGERGRRGRGRGERERERGTRMTTVACGGQTGFPA